MRLHEIYPTQRINRQRSEPYSPTHIDRLRDLRLDRLPSGVFGSASPSREPGEVIKSLHRPSRLDYDGFHQWMVAVQHLHQQGIDNPYFPAVYEIKVTKDPRGHSRPQYRLQRLQELKSVPEAVLAAMFRRMFSDTIISPRLKDYLDQADRSVETGDEDPALLRSELAKHIKSAVEGKPRFIEAIQDPELAQAVKFLRIIAQRRGLTVDLHSGNILVRPGPGGAQLVIADPFSDSDSHSSQPRDWWDPDERRDLKNRSQSRRERLARKPYERISWGDYTVYYHDPQDDSQHITVRQFRARNEEHAMALHRQWRRSPEAEQMAKKLGLSVTDFMFKNTPWAKRPQSDLPFQAEVRLPNRADPVIIDIRARDIQDARLRARAILKGTGGQGQLISVKAKESD